MPACSSAMTAVSRIFFVLPNTTHRARAHVSASDISCDSCEFPFNVIEMPDLYGRVFVLILDRDEGLLVERTRHIVLDELVSKRDNCCGTAIARG